MTFTTDAIHLLGGRIRMTWQRVAALGLLVGGAIAAAAFHNDVLAATLAGAGATATTGVGPIPSFSADVVSGGFVSTCAISGSALTCWGFNDYGILGTNMTGPRDSPTPVVHFGRDRSIFRRAGRISDGVTLWREAAFGR